MKKKDEEKLGSAKAEEEKLGSAKAEEKKNELPEPKSTFIAAVVKESEVKREPEPMRSISPNTAKAATIQSPPPSVKFCDYGLGDKVCPKCGSKKLTGMHGQPKCAISSEDCPFIKR